MHALSRLTKYQGLRRILAAQIPADFADWLDFVAIGALLAFVWESGPLSFAWLALALGLPYVVVGPVAGALVDRSDLKLVLIVSNVGRALSTLSLAFAGNVAILLALVFLRSAIDAFYTPAKQSAIQTLVPTEDLMSANGVSHAINQASKIAGPAVGGGLLVLFLPQQVFLMNAAISLIAALILAGLHRDLRPARKRAARRPILREMAEAMDEVRGTPALFHGLWLMAAGFFAMFFYDALIPLLTKALSFNEAVFGFAIASVGAGRGSRLTWDRHVGRSSAPVPVDRRRVLDLWRDSSARRSFRQLWAGSVGRAVHCPLWHPRCSDIGNRRAVPNHHPTTLGPRKDRPGLIPQRGREHDCTSRRAVHRRSRGERRVGRHVLRCWRDLDDLPQRHGAGDCEAAAGIATCGDGL